MLQAKTEQGNLLTIARFSKENIKLLREKSNFYCPICHEKVIIRAGPHTIPHFAHYKTSTCASLKGGEGPYHEQGKLLLYKWLKKQHLNVTLEKFLLEINQRPDLYLNINGKEIVIEFQCSRIPIKDIQKRNHTYRKLGINPIWILGANQLNRIRYNHLKIDHFTMQFIHKYNLKSSSFLYYFCPRTKQFITIRDLYIINRNSAIQKFHVETLRKMNFNHLFSGRRFSYEELIFLWREKKSRFRLNKRFVRRGRELEWIQWLYLKRSFVEYLPSEIYLPIASQYLMRSSLWDWQSRICLEIIDPLNNGQSFSLQHCVVLLKNHLHNPANFPLIQSTTCPIKEYLSWLVHLRIIEQMTPGHYKKINSLTHYRHIEESMKGDMELLEKVSSKKPNKI